MQIMQKHNFIYIMMRYFNIEFKFFNNFKVSKTALAICFLVMISNIAYSQVTLTTTAPTEITVCSEAKSFGISFKNTSGTTLVNTKVEINFHQGLAYLEGSVSGGSVTESDISNLNKVIFAVPNVANGATVNFSVLARATYSALAGSQAGSVSKNIVKVSWSGGNKIGQTSTYNVLTPSLSITSATDATAFAGQVFTRTVTILNGGFGTLSSFTLTDTYNNALLTLQSVNKGVLAGNTISFSGADFTAIGDGDALFEFNESLVLTETILASGCASTQSTLVAKWGCDGNFIESNKKYPKTTIQSDNLANLVVTAQPTFNTCFSNSGDLQTLTIKNTGTAPVSSAQFVISPNTVDLYTSVDPNSITFQAGTASAIALTATATTNSAAHACLGNNAKSGFTVTLPSIASGQTAYLKWKTNTCQTTACSEVNLIGWKYNATYSNACNSQVFTLEDIGQPTRSKKFTVFVENPSDLVEDQVGEYVFTLNTASFKLPTTSSNSYFQVEFDLPKKGLKWSGNNSDLVFKSGSTTWTPTSVSYSNSTDKLTAKFPFPLPINLSYSEIRVKLKADCSGLQINPVTLNFGLYYVMDGSCNNPFKFSLACSSAPITLIHCPNNNCLGMKFNSFEAKRSSFGKPDNDQNGIADASGVLNTSKIASNRVMASDTFKTTFKGKIFTNGTIQNWVYAYAKSSFARGNSTTALWATLSVFDASTGQTKTANLAPFLNTVATNVRTTTWNMSPAAVGGQFAGFSYGNNDEVTLTAYYKLNGNIGAAMEQVNFTNEMYTTTSAAASATKYQCDNWLGNITFVGYQLRNYKSEAYNVESCTKVINQNFGLFIGQNSIGAGMDVFPFEYRNWAIINDLNVTLPVNYSLVSSSMTQERTIATNGVAVQSVSNITPSSVVGQQLNYSLSNYYTNNGGTLFLSDDGFHGTMSVEIKPTCTAVADLDFAMPWQINFKESANFGGGTTTWFNATSDQVKYSPAKFTFTSPDQIVEAFTPVIAWEVDIRNSTGTPANNSWFYIKSNNGSIQLKSVINRTTNTIITPDANGFYKMNTTAAGGFIKLKIEATYNNCLKDDLQIMAGHSCDAYPTNISTLTCPVEEFKLTYESQDAELQVKLHSFRPNSAGCNDPLTINVDFLSSKFSSITDIQLKVKPTLGSGIRIVNNSTKFKYHENPADNIENRDPQDTDGDDDDDDNDGVDAYVPFSTPVFSNGEYVLNCNSISSNLASSGLPGVLESPKNIFKLKFKIDLGADYQPGETVEIEIFSKKPCGANNVVSSFTFDPTASFERETGIGLDGPLDAWSLSWMDFNNDGYQDVFVGTASGTDPNVLFKNNRNGTFTKETSGAIVTENSKSYASSWADIDNDGDLDGFVATEVGQKNLLYINNGNGTFNKITNDPAVNELGYGRGASWADYDNDGFVDLLVTDYFATKFNLLFHNNGNGTFTKVTNNSIANEAASSVSASWADYNNDGLNDVFICNTNDENNSLYTNLGNGEFQKVTNSPVFTDGGKSIGSSWGDIDNDGDLDLLVVNGGNQKNFLYRNNRNAGFARINNGDLTNTLGNSSGSTFVDFDNDGDLDVFITDDAEKGNTLYSNDGTGIFNKANNNMDNDLGLSSATAWADYDNDGDLDALVANRSGNELFFYKNSIGQCQSTLCLTLKGKKSNRSAIGAKVFVKATTFGKSQWQMRQISSQTGGGIGGQNDIRAIFGLGDATNVDSIQINWPSGFVQKMGSIAIGQCHTIEEETASKVCGSVWIDQDNNCQKNSTEFAVPSTRILIQPGNYYAVTDKDGKFEAYLGIGNYTLTAEPRSGFSVTCPNGSRYVDVLALGQTYCNNDFGLSSNCTKPDLTVDITATALRVGFKNLIAVNWRNNGTQKATGLELSVDFGAYLNPESATIPWISNAGKKLTWSLPDVGISESGTFYVTALVPNTVPINQMVQITANIDCNQVECVNTDNTKILSELTIGALDPNDIAVSPKDDIRPEQQLTYKIRFQNVGTISAKTVIVEDLLPEGLDLSTLEFGAASHSYRLQMSENGRLIRWIFENINLVDSVSNEPLSHGFVTFRIRPNVDIEEGALLPNFASIFFDNQEALKTNTVVNTIKTPVKQVRLIKGQLEIFPNPATDIVNISLAQTKEPAVNFEVYKSDGTLLNTFENPEKLTDFKIYTSDWGAGIYFIQGKTEKGEVWRGKIVKI
jgi:uncharacterized repeat protein (TIGR01451 family)